MLTPSEDNQCNIKPTQPTLECGMRGLYWKGCIFALNISSPSSQLTVGWHNGDIKGNAENETTIRKRALMLELSQALFLLVLTATPPSLSQSPGLQPAFLQSFNPSLINSVSALSTSHAAPGVPFPIRAGLSVFADPTRQGKSVALGSPGVQTDVVLSPRVIKPFVNLGQPQQFGSPGGQPLGGPQKIGSIDTQPTGGPRQFGSLGGLPKGGPQQFGSIGAQLKGGPQQFGSIGGQPTGRHQFFGSIGGQPSSGLQEFGTLGGQPSSGLREFESLGGQLTGGLQQFGSLGGQQTGAPKQFGSLGGQPSGGPQQLRNLKEAGAQPLQLQLNEGPLNSKPLQEHPPRPLMMPGLRPPMTPTQMLKFSVKPQLPPSVNVNFLQEMEVTRDLHALVDPLPLRSQHSQPLPDIPQRLDVQNLAPAPKATIPVESHPAEPIFRDTLPFLPGIGPVLPAVPAVAEPSVEILNQEAQNAGTLLLHSGPGPQVASDIQTDIQPRCKPSFVEECHNEYKMVCEETSIEREKEVCDTVLEEVCETGVTTEYEPACFQQVINHCSNVSSNMWHHH